ncbi:thiamine-phosphate pyrophosphorylase [Mariprofundus micogutta]|uniref:Thiamine-phosphate synthase n=1 Tax=Mariprofundus micogutta TaxID=1921010 RepID=A0A1L8CQZ7_9PROT|nr:thiamine phosphate synthase [Mariprofundus micogutta]GAV21351.1 thiamine-phosphate pyrophosphorylase [Mariprofundus micogutta]
MTDKSVSGIYGILPADIETGDLLDRAEAALKGGVSTLQFRDKKRGYKRAIKRAKALRDLTRSYDARLIINDLVNLAVDADADGVHLGRDDVPNLIQLRNEVGDDFIIGVTCRADAAFAKAALNDGASYVSFGAVLATTTKPEVPEMGLPRLAKAREIFPDANLCAIGGITANNVAQVKLAGADCAAVISGLFAADDIQAEASLLTAIWNQT